MCVAVAWSVEGRGADDVASLRDERDAGTQRRRDNREKRGQQREQRRKDNREKRGQDREKTTKKYDARLRSRLFRLSRPFCLFRLSRLLSLCPLSLKLLEQRRLCTGVESFFFFFFPMKRKRRRMNFSTLSSSLRGLAQAVAISTSLCHCESRKARGNLLQSALIMRSPRSLMLARDDV